MRKLKIIVLLTSTLFISSINIASIELNKIIPNENLATKTIMQEISEEVEVKKTDPEVILKPEVEFISIALEDFSGMIVETVEPEAQDEYVEIGVVVSFYTGLEEENGNGLGGRNAIGGFLSKTSVAIPRKDELVTYGTEIEFERFSDGYMSDYGGQYLTRIADDTGSPKHIRVRDDGIYRMDIYCPRLGNESNNRYWSRVNSYGKYETTAKVYLNKK